MAGLSALMTGKRYTYINHDAMIKLPLLQSRKQLIAPHVRMSDEDKIDTCRGLKMKSKMKYEVIGNYHHRPTNVCLFSLGPSPNSNFILHSSPVGCWNQFGIPDLDKKCCLRTLGIGYVKLSLFCMMMSTSERYFAVVRMGRLKQFLSKAE